MSNKVDPNGDGSQMLQGSHERNVSAPALSTRPKPNLADSSQLEAVWSVAEAAQFLRLHENTVYKLAKARELPAAKIGNRWRFRPHDLDMWLRRRVSWPSNPALSQVQ